jgi:vacuolar protein sorting-associated protein VTA1
LAFDASNLSVLPQPKPRAAPVDLPTVQPSTYPSEAPSSFTASNSSNQFSPNPEQVALAQKLCKYASSALTYDDVPTAIDNLQKALRLLQTGQQ